MRYLLLRIMPAVWMLLSLAACSDDGGTEKTAPEIEPSSYQFDTATSKEFRITYEKGWTAALSDGSWCSLDKTSGNGNGLITVTLSERTDLASLSSVLTVASSENPSLSKTVMLSMPAVEFAVSPSPVFFSKNVREAEVSVTYQGKWKAVLGDDTWCSADVAGGTGNGIIRLTMTAGAISGKTSTLIVSPEDYPALSSTINIIQTTALLHGELTVLNKATKGDGIDMVILGDGFTADNMEDGGKWPLALEMSEDALFMLEPFTTFRDHFNLYAVTAVSESDEIGLTASDKTFFQSYFNGDRQFLINNTDRERAYELAYTKTPVKAEKGTMKDMLVIMLVNDTRYGGAGYLDDKNVSMGTGMGTSSMNTQYFNYLILHESLGHAFGKLADEYTSYQGSINDAGGTFGVYQSRQDKAKYGHWQNIEFTDDPGKFDNTAWRELYKEGYPGVIIVEGGHYYPKDVWRSSYVSLMKGTDLSVGINTVGREIIVRKIYQLSGMSSQYSLDLFKEYDKVNTGLQRMLDPVIAVPPAGYHRPPIVGE